MKTVYSVSLAVTKWAIKQIEGEPSTFESQTILETWLEETYKPTFTEIKKSKQKYSHTFGLLFPSKPTNRRD